MSDEIGLAAEQRRHFTPRWFVDLLGARLSLGDTFWIGAYGTALIFVPVGIILQIAAGMFLPSQQIVTMLGIQITFMALFYGVLLTAVFRTARRTPQVGAWRWIGVFIVLVNAALLAFLSYLFWFGAETPLPGLLR